MSTSRALIYRLTDEHVQALWVILSSMAWPEEEISPEEAEEINQARAEIEAGKGVKAGDVWRELGMEVIQNASEIDES